MPILVQWKREEKREYSYIRLMIGVLLLIVVGLVAWLGTFIRAEYNTMGSILLIVAGIILIIIFVVAIYLLKQQQVLQ